MPLGSFRTGGGIGRRLAPTIQYVQATGGTIDYVNVGGTWYKLHKFLSTGNSTFTVTQAGPIAAAIVGGGGSGGGKASLNVIGGGGGGGGGQVRWLENISTAAQAYTITVGSGGSSGNNAKNKGGTSSAFGYSAEGGGYGGVANESSASQEGGAGGSAGGGGAAAGGSSYSGTPGSGTQAGGNDGYYTISGNPYPMGGGGGSNAAAGSNANSGTKKAGNGAVGVNLSSYLGTGVGQLGYFGGGGGGGLGRNDDGLGDSGDGGLGGGGKGAIQTSSSGGSGTANTGGGGGGAGNSTYSTVNSSAGGSGVVIVRYPVENFVARASAATRAVDLTGTTVSSTGGQFGGAASKTGEGSDVITLNPTDTNWQFAFNKPWTVEFFFKTSTASYTAPANITLGGTNFGETSGVLLRLPSGVANTLRIFIGNSSFDVALSTSYRHFAIVNEGNGTCKLYVNGTLTGTKSNFNYTPSSNGKKWYYGSTAGNAGQPTYFWDEMRFSYTARYTSNFTAPSAAFTNDSSTLGLFHFDNNYNDDNA